MYKLKKFPENNTILKSMENKAAKQAVEAVTSDVLKYTQPGIRKYAFLDQ